MPLPEVE